MNEAEKQSSLFGWTDKVSSLLGVVEDSHSKRRVPCAQLPKPLPQDGGRADNEAGAEFAAVMQASKKGHQLDGLAKTHLIPNDASCPLRVQLPQPFHTYMTQLCSTAGKGRSQEQTRLQSDRSKAQAVSMQ